MNDAPKRSLEKLPPTPEPDPFAAMVEKVAPYLVQAMEKHGEIQLKIAETNKPIYEANAALEKQRLSQQHDAWSLGTNASISKDKREFISGVLFAAAILIFLMSCAVVLFIKDQNYLALSVITLLVGLIGGFGGGTFWQKQHDKKPQ